jgi:glutaconate CoA-transferase subunit B
VGGGPSAVVTTLGILRPDARTKELVLDGYYAFSSPEEVREQTGWPLRFAATLAPVPEPTASELEALRRVDTGGVLRKS